MSREIIEQLTTKDDKRACAVTAAILKESRETDHWYAMFDTFATLLEHPKSLVRNRAIGLLAANARWDSAGRLDCILPAYLAHITDDKPITARQCIQSLAEVGAAKPELIAAMLAALDKADFSGYRDSMRPLLEKDARQAREALLALQAAPEATGKA